MKNYPNMIIFTLVFSILLTILLTGGCKDKMTNDDKQNNNKQNETNNDMKNNDKTTNYNKLNEDEKNVILNKATEPPFVGKYTNNFETGIYICKQCNKPLYKSDDKFHSNCGWPSFDDNIEGAVKRIPDRDGIRIEILCANCDGHLGHVFTGEGFTDKNTRHCVNSISMKFVKTDEAIFAGGCFWGVQYHISKLDGVTHTEVGYTGGHVNNPTYKQVCSGTTGHIEAIRIYFDTEIITYEELAKFFFEIHDPTQVNRQGPDIGEQYRSAIFCKNNEQKEIIGELIFQLEEMGYDIATTIEEGGTFWVAEDYHQDYYDKKSGIPYCHVYKKKWK